ncbi:MAG: ribbon-helix-helix domain-containing protein [Patescibacteria group bacterium]
MRNIINISLPQPLVKVVDKATKSGNYSSKSEFIRMLIRLWMERQLINELEESRSELRSGKGKVLKTLRDLRT